MPVPGGPFGRAYLSLLSRLKAMKTKCGVRRISNSRALPTFRTVNTVLLSRMNRNARGPPAGSAERAPTFRTVATVLLSRMKHDAHGPPVVSAECASTFRTVATALLGRMKREAHGPPTRSAECAMVSRPVRPRSTKL